MSPVVLSSIETFDGDRCVDIFQRADGTFGFDEFRRDPETKTGWVRIGQFENDVFDVLTDIACFGQRCRISNSKWNIQQSGKGLRQQRFTDTRWTNQQNITFL